MAINEVAEAFDVIKKAMKNDSDYAWTWHCNIAVSFMDEIKSVSHEEANKAAARFMQTIFEVDVTIFDTWKSFECTWDKIKSVEKE